MSSSNRRGLAREGVRAVFADAGQCVRAIFDGRRSSANDGNFIQQKRSVRKHDGIPYRQQAREGCLKHT